MQNPKAYAIWKKTLFTTKIILESIVTSESQNVEFKLTWKDEYLKQICGFANAYGGTIFIGKDDEGNVVDLKDAKKLLEEIPNKVRDTLGILIDVNLH